MSLDLRLPMGLMFTLTGTILTAFGLATRGNQVLYARSVGIDVNLWWGAVLLVFGIFMLVLGRRGQMRAAREREKQESGIGGPGSETNGRPRAH
jgi:predicted ABC-type sugar transport system permease subunit